MSNFLPATKDRVILALLLSAFHERTQPPIGDREEEKCEDQPTSSKDKSCPPKVDSSTNSLDKGEPVDYGKFNGPLEKPKTASKAFGSISDFLWFFENRNPEIKEFAKKFQEMEDLEKNDPVLSLKILNDEIAPSVYKSFMKVKVELKNHEPSKPVVQEDEKTQKLKNAFSKFLQKKKNPKDPRIEYSQLFEKEFKTIEEFYKQILYAYTIPGFLYLRMNEYLRNESWIKLDDLLIYTYCLFKAYLWGPTGFTDADSFEYLKSKSNNTKLILYRRADFDQGSLDFYQLDKIKEFSWTGVTSTSLLESATRKFAGKQPNKKPVLITIEVDFNNLQPENFNALYLAKISKCPGEEEVALAPGSIFELLEINQDQPEVVMRLRLITNAKILAQQGKFLHGMLQAVMGNGEELKIVCLKDKELSRAIKHCQGNQLIKKLEFHLCNFNDLSIQVLLEVLPTMKNLISFTFNSVEVQEYWPKILECLGKKKIKNLDIENSIYEFTEILSFFSRFKDLTSLENLKLSFGENARIDFGNIRTLFNLVNNLAPKCAFEFHMTNICEVIIKGLKKSSLKKHLAEFLCQIEENSRNKAEDYFIEFPSEDEFRNIIAQQSGIRENPENQIEEKVYPKGIVLDLIGIKELFGYSFERNSKNLKTTLLEVLEEKFTFNSKKSDANGSEHSIIEEFKGLDSTEKQPLKELSLSFERCNMIRSWNLKSLGQDLQYLESLTTLKLNFNKCNGKRSIYSGSGNGITDSALEILSKNIIQQLKGLNRLDLSFDGCYEITDFGLMNLAYHGIQHLQFLTALSLSFGVCQSITDQGLMMLTLEGITKLKSLATLHLNFNDCVRITDEGLESLFQADGGIQSLEFMSYLSLSFKSCNITDEGIQLLSYIGLQNLKKSLNSLSLNFDECNQITDEGLKVLSCEGLFHLESLTKLDLSFSHQESQVTDLGIKAIAQNLRSLTTLRLGFETCQEITDEGLNSFCFSKELIVLDLNFNDCSQITDFGLENLSKKIQHLKSLEHLQLNFGDCQNITDDGLDFLCSKGIRNLHRLNTLHLNFELFEREKPRITDKGLKSLVYGIQNLLELRVFHLDLKNSNITDEGLHALISQGILPQKESLNTLHLNLSSSVELSDVGLKSFWSKGVRYLSKLEKLYVNFEGCQKITTEGLDGLVDEGVRHLPLLAILDLRFFNCPKITYEQLLSIKYQINLLGLPQLQASFGALLEGENLESAFLQGPGAASVFCQGRLGFFSEGCPELKETIESPVGKPVEGLILKFPQGFDAKSPQDLVRDIPYHLEVCPTDLDLFRSILSEEKMKNFKDLKTLNLTLDQCATITDFTLRNLCLNGLKHFESLTALHLSFRLCTQITDSGLQLLGCQGLKYLKKLTNLSLNFELCYYITDNGLAILKEIPHPELLNELKLSFRGCTNVGNRGIINLCKTGLRHLKSLTSLSLNFDWCQNITNKGLKKLYDYGLKRLGSLKSMHLSFKDCRQITKRGLKSLCRISMQPLTSFFIDLGGVQIPETLKQQLFQSSSDSFILIRKNESSCKIETSKLRRQNIDIQKDDGGPKSEEAKPPGKIIANRMFFQYIGRSFYLLNIYAFPKLERLSQERYGREEDLNAILANAKDDIIALLLLSNRKKFPENVENFINQLYAQWIGFLQPLTFFHLTLGGWKTFITDSSLYVLCLKILQSLTSLTTFHLILDGCSNISNEGLKNLGAEGIRHLKSLTTLCISFDSQVPINEIGLKSLCSEGIQHLKYLAKLRLDFKGCDGVTDIAFENLWNDGILLLKSLTALELSFERCQNMTGLCFKNIKSEEAKDLKSLTQLHLNFDSCVDFKDEGFENLCINVIQNCTELTTLELYFNGCEGITDSGLQYLDFSNLQSLTNLSLSFDRCQGLTDKGIQSPKLHQLKLLTILHLHFDQCHNLTAQAFNNEIAQFKSLQALHMSFRGCSGAVADLNIAHLTSLNTLYLCFDGCKQITDKDLHDLCCNGIQPLKFLKTLYLSFGFCPNITEKSLESLYNDGIRHLDLLSNIYLCFLACKEISKTQLSLLQSRIVSLDLPGLQSLLKLNNNTIFSESDFHQKGFLDFILSSQECSRLSENEIPSINSEKLKMYTDLEEVTLQKLQENKILTDINFDFENRSHLAHLGLVQSFFSCQDAINNLEEIEEVHLIFANFLSQDNLKLLNMFCDVHQYLRSVKNLQIVLDRCDDFGNNELKIISDKIGGLEKLSQLQLSLDSCQGFGDEELESLWSGIQHHKELKALNLSFNRCSDISDDGLNSVTLKGILSLSSLEDLELSFENCANITYSSHQAFLKILTYFGFVEANKNRQKKADTRHINFSYRPRYMNLLYPKKKRNQSP